MMQKISNTNQLLLELQEVTKEASRPNPSKVKLACQLRDLANRLDATMPIKIAAQKLPIFKSGESVNVSQGVLEKLLNIEAEHLWGNSVIPRSVEFRPGVDGTPGSIVYVSFSYRTTDGITRRGSIETLMENNQNHVRVLAQIRVDD